MLLVLGLAGLDSGRAISDCVCRVDASYGLSSSNKAKDQAYRQRNIADCLGFSDLCRELQTRHQIIYFYLLRALYESSYPNLSRNSG